MKTYNWEGVNPDGYFLDKLEPIPSALPSLDRKSGSAGMPRPISYADFCLKKKLVAKCTDAVLGTADGRVFVSSDYATSANQAGSRMPPACCPSRIRSLTPPLPFHYRIS